MAPRVLLLSVLAAALAGCSAPQAETATNASDARSMPPVSDSPDTPLGLPRCVGTELTLFACPLRNGKSVALCASPDASPTAGYVRYAFGAGESAELNFPEPLDAPGDRFRSTRVLFPSGNGRHTYSFERGGYRYIAYQLWAARDGNSARGGLMVLNAAGLPLIDLNCSSLNDAEQEALALPPYPMPEDELLGATSTLPFGDSRE